MKIRSWSAWRALARRQESPGDPDLDSCKLNLAQARVALQRAPVYLTWLKHLSNAEPADLETLAQEPFCNPAYQMLWNRPAHKFGVTTLREALVRLYSNTTFMKDLKEIVEWSQLRSNASTPPLEGLPSTLELHGIYSPQEINAAFGKTSLSGGGSRGTGVIPVHDHKVIVHLVTFEKTERQFSESTMYRDFPTCPDLLHWESQSVAAQDGKLGRLYASHDTEGYKILFFSRIRREVTKGITTPFLFLGAGKFIDAHGNYPISIRWHLENPMPMSHYREARLVCGLKP